MIDDSSLKRLAFPFSNTGFFKRVRLVPITHSAFDGLLPVNLEQ